MNISQAISRLVSYCRRFRGDQPRFRIAACAVLAAVFSSPQLASATIVRIETNLGGFNVELYDNDAPKTVANFLYYINQKDYDNSVIHRHATIASSSGVAVIQGGGYAYQGNFLGSPLLYDFPKASPIVNEYSALHPNVRGTIAMAKLSGNADSATSEWFINLDDANAAALDSSNSGGFTVFGDVISPGMDVVDSIANFPTVAKLSALVTETVTNPDGTTSTSSSYKDFPDFPYSNGNVVIVNKICINNDGDASCPEIEDLAPNNGDGNGDGIPDRDQPNVTTIQTPLGSTATFASDAAMTFGSIKAIDNATLSTWLKTFSAPPNKTVQFTNAIYTFTMTGTMNPASRDVTLFESGTASPNRYYAYGPTPDNTTPHWYDFTFDGVTGAEVVGGKVVLHLVDGLRGDDDLTVNNSITHTGVPALVTDGTGTSSSSNSAGCSIAAGPSSLTSGGDWAAVSMFLAFIGLVRRRKRLDRARSTRASG